MPLVIMPVLLGRCTVACLPVMQEYTTFAPTLQGRWRAVMLHVLHVGHLVLLLRCRAQPRVGIIAWLSGVQETTFGTKAARAAQECAANIATHSSYSRVNASCWRGLQYDATPICFRTVCAT